MRTFGQVTARRYPGGYRHERHLPVSTVESLVSQNTDGRAIGFLGEPGVNVLKLNIALDALPKQ